jgi:hypothetical protein
MNAMIPSGSIAASSARPRAEITSQHDTAVRASCLAQRFAYRITAVVAEGAGDAVLVGDRLQVDHVQQRLRGTPNSVRV